MSIDSGRTNRPNTSSSIHVSWRHAGPSRRHGFGNGFELGAKTRSPICTSASMAAFVGLAPRWKDGRAKQGTANQQNGVQRLRQPPHSSK
jgi:hypothetical protein